MSNPEVTQAGVTEVDAFKNAVETAGEEIGRVLHGNDLSTTKPARGYTLRGQNTGAILKYGETTIGLLIMHLWTSGEIDADVGDAFQETRRSVQDAVNRVLHGQEYGGELEEWAYIAIITSWRDDDAYPEVAKYRRKKREVEFRLRIAHAEFKAASPDQRCRLFLESLARSVQMMPEVGVQGIDSPRLVSDLMRLGKEEGWV